MLSSEPVRVTLYNFFFFIKYSKQYRFSVNTYTGQETHTQTHLYSPIQITVQWVVIWGGWYICIWREKNYYADLYKQKCCFMQVRCITAQNAIIQKIQSEQYIHTHNKYGMVRYACNMTEMFKKKLLFACNKMDFKHILGWQIGLVGWFDKLLLVQRTT